MMQYLLLDDARKFISDFVDKHYEMTRDDVLPWCKGRDNNQWIEDIRHDNSRDAVLGYLRNTRGKHNLGLLMGTGRLLMRIQKDQEEIGTSSQQQKNFFGDFWWGQGDFGFEWVGDRTAFYLLFGCKANDEQTVQVMKSLGWHSRNAERKILNAYDHLAYEYKLKFN